MISGNMTLPPTLGHRKLTSVDHIQWVQSDFPSAVKDISVPALILPFYIKISGNMIPHRIHGHRRPTLGELQDSIQSDSLSAAKDISVPAMIFPSGEWIS